MNSAWRPPTEPATVGDPERVVMLISGQSFCLASDAGDIVEGAPHGWFVADRRALSRCEMFVNGSPLDVLAVNRAEPFESVHVGRTPPDQRRSLLVLRRRVLDEFFSDEVELRNHSDEPRRCRIVFKVAADFADLFAVKDGREIRPEPVTCEVGDILDFQWKNSGQVRRLTIEPLGSRPCDVMLGRLVWDFVLEAGGTETVGVSAGHELSGGTDQTKTPTRSALSVRDRSQRWESSTARITRALPRVQTVVAQSLDDLGSLRLTDTDQPDQIVVVAGAPWFMTLFGRDSLLTSYMSLMFDHTIARGCVNALARLQGDSFEDSTDEDPGRILHELRFADADSFSLADGAPYYGSVDATPLFVMLVGELARWGGLDQEELRNLLPAVDRALAWIEVHGDLDGDGFVEYLTRSSHGLVNQGWKDSHDGIRYGDGRVAEAPIALAEVQAYVYGAYVARAVIAAALDEGAEAVSSWEHRAVAFADRFDEAFWIDSEHGYAIGLDADKRHIDAVASNMGHCLWAGIALPHRSGAIAALLSSPAMSTGWGIRTLSSENPGFDPLSYHCGSVWPHDTALAAMGLMRYGHVDQAIELARAIFDVADRFDGRLPELIAGLSSSEIPIPVRYPTSCSPQAWAAASPLYMLQMMLGFQPDLPSRRVTLDPHLSEWTRPLRIERIPLGGGTISISVGPDQVDITDLPDDVVIDRRETSQRANREAGLGTESDM